MTVTHPHPGRHREQWALLLLHLDLLALLPREAPPQLLSALHAAHLRMHRTAAAAAHVRERTGAPSWSSDIGLNRFSGFTRSVLISV